MYYLMMSYRHRIFKLRGPLGRKEESRVAILHVVNIIGKSMMEIPIGLVALGEIRFDSNVMHKSLCAGTDCSDCAILKHGFVSTRMMSYDIHALRPCHVVPLASFSIASSSSSTCRR